MLEILKTIRSHRSFLENTITNNELRYMVEGARYAGSTRNSQKVRFALISDKNLCDSIFNHVKFAGALEWNPTPNESPNAYILLCSSVEVPNEDKSIYFDMGLASQNILLMADSLGYKGCILAAYNKKEVEAIVGLNENYKSYFLIALGVPKDNVTVVPAVLGNTKYSRINDNHYVPKLALDEIIISEK